jgi:hypothetical protein
VKLLLGRIIQLIQDVCETDANDEAGGERVLEDNLLFAAIGPATHAGQQIKPRFFLRTAVFKQTHGVFATLAEGICRRKPFLRILASLARVGRFETQVFSTICKKLLNGRQAPV